ncbi:MAG: extracellular solute-binding protein [Lachnospiraceae bacterium]|nr:extracellular solute-binding protein [Lachnospiraceae bacterium]
MKKLIALLIIVIMAASLFVGCGNNQTTDTSTDTATADDAATDDTVVSGDMEVVELNVLIGQPRFRAQYEAFFDKFIEKMAGEGIDLTINLEMPGDDEVTTILQTRFASNNSPDVFNFHPTNNAPIFFRAGWFADLSDQPFVADLWDDVRDSVTFDGQTVGVPLESAQWGMLYNQDIFDEHDWELPSTLSEMEDLIAEMEAAGVTPFVLSYGEGWLPQLLLPLTVGSLIQTENPDFIEQMNAGETSFAEFRQMFDIMDLSNAHGTPNPFEVGADQGAADFANGAAAMYIQGPWMADSILSVNPDIRFSVAPLPVDNNPDGTLINVGFSNALGVSAFSEHQEIAAKLINFVLDPSVTNELFESLGFNPVSAVQTFDVHPWQVESSALIAAGRSYNDTLIPGPVRTASESAFQSYFAGTMNQDEVIAALDQAWADYIAQQ